MSAQKALQGCKTVTRELLGGTEENSVSRRGVIKFTKGNRKKLSLIAARSSRKVEITSMDDRNLEYADQFFVTFASTANFHFM